ncbi:hypothetical protein At1D1108_45640 (plasmid) [Agrobacterium tumefaciens]|nr:hypothetical protein At1D1108_45640 [Agrobacterium tumefaciens]
MYLPASQILAQCIIDDGLQRISDSLALSSIVEKRERSPRQPMLQPKDRPEDPNAISDGDFFENV